MDIKEQLKTLSGEMKNLIQERDTQIKELGQAREDTAKKLDETGAELVKLQEEMAEKHTALEKEVADMKKLSDNGRQNRIQTPGTKFVNSDSYKNMREEKSRRCAPVEVGSMEKRADSTWGPLVSGTDEDTGVGAITDPDRMPGMVEKIFEPISMRDIVGRGTTSTDQIEYLKESFDNKADFVDDKNLTEVDGDSVLALKQRSGIKFEKTTVNVVTLAHYLAVGKNALADASQIQSRINVNGIKGLAAKEDYQIINGTGGDDKFTGILNNSGIAEETGYPTAATNALDRIRISIARNRKLGYAVDGIVMDPITFATMQILKGDDKHYIWIEAGEGMAATVWRIPVVENNGMPEDKYLLGDFGGSTMLWDRQQASISVTDSHKDWFARNMLAVLIEARMAFEVTRPAAFRLGDANVVTTT